MRALLGVLLVTTGLAGCIGGEDAELEAADLTLPDLGLPDSFEFVCPAGETTSTVEGICVRTIASLTESNQEPFLAIDPSRPDVMAVGVNSGYSTDALDPSRQTGLEVIGYDVFFTEDAGATWTRTRVPYVAAPSETDPVETRGAGDPAFQFDADGVLHASGIVTNDIAFRGFEIFYTSTPDLGASWTEPVLFTEDGGNDRNWLNLGTDGTVYLPWQFFKADVADGGSTVAWSTDGGTNWEMFEKGAHISSCYGVGQVAIVGGQPYVACASATDEFDLEGIRFIHIDTAGKAFHDIAMVEQEGAYWPQPVVTPDGTVVMVFEDFADATVRIVRSVDGGVSWSEPADVRDLLSVDDNWAYANNYWFEADPWGAVHMIVGASECSFALLFANDCSRVLAHLAIDPATWTVLSETVLDASGPPVEDMHVPPPLAPEWGDHYYGIAFTEDAGYMVWTREQVLEFTSFEPIWTGAAQ